MLKLLDKKVCSECSGISLGRYIIKYGKMGECSYCKKKSNPTMVIEGILPRLYQSWELFYESPEDYPNLQNQTYIRYSTDIINDEDIELTDSSDSFWKDLYAIVDKDNKWWLRKKDVWLSFPTALTLSWDNFTNLVKNHEEYDLYEKLDYEPTTYSPHDMLDIICEMIKCKENLVTELPVRTSFFRTRKGNKKFPINAKELGTTPEKKAKANRFSSKGIPMFYGSFDRNTCRKEAYNGGKYIVTGEFYNSNSIRLLDLTNIPEIPKLYDDDFGFIPVLTFLHNFSKIISKNVGQNQLEYIPTQFFTKYIREKGLKNYRLKGIKYNSEQNIGGINLVLFYTNADCIDENEYEGESDCLVLKKFYEG